MTPHFSREELQCKCGCEEMKFTQLAVESLEAVRVEFGVPMIISSGYRCPKHNQEVSSTGADGPHTIFDGANITVDVKEFGTDAYDLIEIAIAHGFSGIGLNQKGPFDERFIHLDRLESNLAAARARPNVWTY